MYLELVKNYKQPSNFINKIMESLKPPLALIKKEDALPRYNEVSASYELASNLLDDLESDIEIEDRHCYLKIDNIG